MLKQKNEFIQSPDDLPSYSKLLSGVRSTDIIRINESERSLYAVLFDESTKNLCLLSTKEATENVTGIKKANVQGIIKRHKDNYTFNFVHNYICANHIIEGIYNKNDIDNNGDNTESTSIEESERLREFQSIIENAVKYGTSDVHFIIGRTGTVRFRVHGELQNYITDMEYTKAMAILRAAYATLGSDRSHPTFNDMQRQDCRIDMMIGKSNIRLRYSHNNMSDGSVTGVHCAMRILKLDAEKPLPLELLGYSNEQIKMIGLGLSCESGAIIIAGTTGSGKSTTITTLCDSYIENSDNKKIVLTVEDPPEYQIPRAIQSQVIRTEESKRDGINMVAESIISAMRRDPDAILVGECRDYETAEALRDAALTGHLCIATIHASGTLDTLLRLEGMRKHGNQAITRNILGGRKFISLLLYQKLLPVLCEECKIPLAEASKIGIIKQDLYNRILSNIDKRDMQSVFIRNKDGCPKCSHMGITGRTVAAEVMYPDDKMRMFFRESKDIEAYSHWRGQSKGRMVGITIMQHAISKIIKGKVCPSDVESNIEPLGMDDALDDSVMTDAEAQALSSTDILSSNIEVGREGVM